MRPPDTRNELGTGTLPPAMEAWLVARGAVFAHTVETPAGTTVEFSCRPLHEAHCDAEREARRRLAQVPPAHIERSAATAAAKSTFLVLE